MKQTMRYSDAELDVMKTTFAENEDLLKAIRRVMLQMGSEEITFPDGTLKLLRKVFLPELEPDAPLQQQIDLWMTLNISDKPPELAYDHLLAREKLITLIDQGLSRLDGAKGKNHLNITEMTELKGKTSSEAFTDMIARNTYINHVEQQLSQILILSGLKEENVEQTLERLKKDSSK